MAPSVQLADRAGGEGQRGQDHGHPDADHDAETLPHDEAFRQVSLLPCPPITGMRRCVTELYPFSKHAGIARCYFRNRHSHATDIGAGIPAPSARSMDWTCRLNAA